MSDWVRMYSQILQLEQEGVVTRTFRRLDPERQEAILTAILDEAAERGPGAVNIKEVARRAGVSVGSLYTYFPSREGMLAFAVQVCVRFVSQEFEQYRTFLAALPLRKALEAYLLGGIEWSHMYMGMLRLFARAAYHGDRELSEVLVRPVATLLRSMVRDMLVQAAQRGEIRDDVDLEAASRILHALTIAAADSQLLPYLNTYYQIIDDDLPAERMLEALLSLVTEGLGKRQTE